MNAEIVARIETYSVLHDQMLTLAEQRFQLQGELEATRTALHESRQRETKVTAAAEAFDYMSTTLRRMHETDRQTLEEVEAIIRYLEADRVIIEAELDEETLAPSTRSPGPLNSPLAQRLVEAVDERMGLMARLILRVLPNAADQAVARRAKVASHAAGISDLAREVVLTFDVEQKCDPAEFEEQIEGLIESAPEDKQSAYRAAFREAMPRLFPGWKP